MSELFNLVQPWLLDSDSDDLIALRDHLLWMQKELFDEYEPNRYESFDDRVVTWLRNLSDENDQKSFFRLLRHLFFVGKQQFDSLCRAAYHDQATRWVIDLSGANITDPQLGATIDNMLSRTWFCPITDSMRINAFLKLNDLPGHDHRPDWRSLMEFGDPVLIQQYVAKEGIQHLVMLEDFVGGGSQIKDTVEWAARTLPAIPILVIPLVCCPRGVTTGAAISQQYPNVTFAPTLTLRPQLFLCETPRADEPEIFARVREIILRIQPRLDAWQQQPFGFDRTGALIALYSNCPDNTLPIVHHRGTQWAPLFSRVRRS